MLRYLKNILIPVDFSINTEIAIKKAIELADAGCTIHLLYIINNTFPNIVKRSYFKTTGLPEIEKNLIQWKSTISDCYSHLSVKTHIVANDNIQSAIENQAKQLEIDLIIVAKHSHHSWLPFLNTLISSEIVSRTGISVLTVKPGAIYQKLKSIVVPISDEVTRNKILVLDTLSRKFFFKIHLVTFKNSTNELPESIASSFLETYNIIKRAIRFPIEYAILNGSNKAKAILNYSKNVNADSLLLYPKTETQIGWVNSHISDFLPPESKLQVLTINPGSI